MIRADQVWGPAMPSTVRPLARWKARTARSVMGPKIPSTCRSWPWAHPHHPAGRHQPRARVLAPGARAAPRARRDERRATGATPCWRRLRLAVRRRMVADVPVGVLLSGGLDSSLVVALLADEGQVGLKTFSVGFHATGGESGDEFEYSDLIAEHFATDHQQILVDPARMLPAVDSAIARHGRADGQPRLRRVPPALRGGRQVGQGRAVRAGRRRGVRRLRLVPAAGRGPPGTRGRGLRRGVHRPPARRAGRRSWNRSGCSTTTRAGPSSPSTSPHRAPTTRWTPRCGWTRRSCWWTTRSSGSTT